MEYISEAGAEKQNPGILFILLLTYLDIDFHYNLKIKKLNKIK